MRSKRISADEQLRLIMECRKSGLSDYLWCQMHNINPGTFYNWVSRLRRRGSAIPAPVSCQQEEVVPYKQEVVKVDLLSETDLIPVQMDQETPTPSTSPGAATHLAVKILMGNATVRFFNDTDQRLVETTLRCLGGVMYAG